MKQINWSEVEEAKVGDYKVLEPGGYVCQLLRVNDEPNKNRLYVEFDIVDGEFKDYYTELNAKYNKWNGKIFLYYTDKSMPFFKQFLTSVERSNDGFKANTFSDERTLIGKYVGMLFGREFYNDKDSGEVKSSVKPFYYRDIFTIKEGKFQIPKDKYAKDFVKEQQDTLNDPDLIPLVDDCPF